MVQKKAPAKPAAKKGGKKAAPVEQKNPLFVARPRHFGVGGDLQPKKARDLTRFVRWPLYVKRQRQQRVLERRVRVPPAVNQFRRTLDKINTAEVYKLAAKYKPETAAAAKKRLAAEAKARMKASHDNAKAARKAKKSFKTPASQLAAKNKYELTFGVQEVVRSVEHKNARLVLIAHDVDPLEVVLAIPALCQKLGVPYAIVKGKAALGRLVNQKTATCVSFENVRPEDNASFNKVVQAVNTSFAEKFDDIKKQWGGNQRGTRAQHKRNAAIKQKLKR